MAFCGFYVAKADSSLFNQSSQVIYVRDENRSVITMYSDYQGDLKDFALVVPVPEVLTKEQINVADRAIIERVDAYSAPRLVEMYDSDPCSPPIRLMGKMMSQGVRTDPLKENSYGVKVEAKYTVGEYDILILSAVESSGLETWLRENGYRIPTGASEALKPYIRQKLKFFVAKVNLKEQIKLGYVFLRPIQFAFESPKFMLPLRLGMLNANGEQELYVYAITKRGRVESTNYRNVKLPTDASIPAFVKNEFPDFYRSLFRVAHERENKKVVFTEYVWDMSSCDPCAAEPLSQDELRKIGVFWLPDSKNSNPNLGLATASVFMTRMHLRYDKKNFPEDLFFHQTGDTQNYQGRYIINYPWTKGGSCPAVSTYETELKNRSEKESQTLAALTGWSMKSIEEKLGRNPQSELKENGKWYKKIF